MNITVPTNFICRSRWHAKKGEGRRREERRRERENTIKMTSKSKCKENKKITPQVYFTRHRKDVAVRLLD